MPTHRSSTLEPLESRVLFSAGDFDPAFNHGELLTTAFSSGSSVVTDIEVLPDGGFITAGTVRVRDGNNPTEQTKLAIAKYRFDGSLDPSFGVNGQIENTPRSMTGAIKVESTPDGGFIVMGSSLTAAEDATVIGGDPAMLLKFTSTGKVDTHFGKNGVLKPEHANTFTVDPQGRILVGGFRLHPVTATDATVTRYTADGALDSRFKQFVFVSPAGGEDEGRSDTFNSIAVDQQGRIIAAHEAFDTSGGGENGLAFQSLQIVRLTSTGDLDTFYGNNGNSQIVDDREIARVLDDGSIILIGETIARIGPDGNLDPSYGNAGIAATSKHGLTPRYNVFQNQANNRFAVSADGSVVFANLADPGVLQLTRIDSHGQPDVNFGTSGTLTVSTNSDVHAEDYLGAVALAPDSSIVIGGQTGILSPTGRTDTRTFTVGRLMGGAGPAVQLVPRLLKEPSRFLYITVLIRDPDGIDLSTLDDNDLRLMDPLGNTRKFHLVGSGDVNDDGRYLLARYRITGPNHHWWDSSSKGTYDVRLQRKQIADHTGNFAVAQSLGTVRVDTNLSNRT